MPPLAKELFMRGTSYRSWTLLGLLLSAGHAVAAEKELDADQQRVLRSLIRLNGDVRTYVVAGKPVVAVNLAYNLEVTDDDLAQLAKLTSLVSLQLGGPPITTRTLDHLKGLANLRQLDLPVPATRTEEQHA